MQRTAVDPSSSAPSTPFLQSPRVHSVPTYRQEREVSAARTAGHGHQLGGNPGLLPQSPCPELLCLLPDLARVPMNASLSHAHLTSAAGTCFQGSREVQELVSILKKAFHKLLLGGQVCPQAHCHRYPHRWAQGVRTPTRTGVCSACALGVTRRLQRRRYISELGHSFC